MGCIGSWWSIAGLNIGALIIRIRFSVSSCQGYTLEDNLACFKLGLPLVSGGGGQSRFGSGL